MLCQSTAATLKAQVVMMALGTCCAWRLPGRCAQAPEVRPPGTLRIRSEADVQFCMVFGVMRAAISLRKVESPRCPWMCQWPTCSAWSTRFY